MKNMYFHEFVLGFNSWYVVAPAILVAMIFAGFFGVKMIDGREQKLQNKRFYAILSACSGVFLGVLLMAESGDGLVQFLDNRLGVNESGVWSLVIAPLAIMAISAIFGYVCFRLALEIQTAHYNHLRSLRLQVAKRVRREYSDELTDRIEDLNSELEIYKLEGPNPETVRYLENIGVYG